MAEYIVENHPEVKVTGSTRWHSTASLKNLSELNKKVELYECDLNDLSSVIKVLKNIKPDVIFHLASHANVRVGFEIPIAVLNNNINSTINIFEALKLLNIEPIVQMCSTSEVYGIVDKKNVPITEYCPINPASPYAVSKVTQDLLSKVYNESYGLRSIRTRMFSYLNPRREDLFATSFAKQVALIEKGRKKNLSHGNLDSVRTIIDHRDAMRAYWITVQKCKIGEVYNIGGEKVISVGDFLEILLKKARCKIITKVDKTR